MVHHTERGSQTHARLGKLRMIEQVEYFSTKLQIGLLGYVEGLVGREIKVRHASGAQARVNPRFVSIREGPRFREAAGVEPLQGPDRAIARYALITSWSVVWPNDAATQAKPGGAPSKILRQRIRVRGKSDGNAAPESGDSIDAPTADDGVRNCVDVREEHLLMSKG